jgi:ABC-type cobalamin/Fe3+-siderophores transport system ATPase subunit
LIWSTHDPNHLTQAADHVLMLHRTGSAVLAPTALALTPAALRAQFDLPFTQVQTASGPQFLPDFAQHEA